MKSLKPPESHHLRAAEGWLELGNHFEANEELKKISLEWRFHPLVLLARWEIYAQGKHWEFAYTMAHGMVAMYPEDPIGYIKRSIALHAMKRTPEAWQSLLPATEKFPTNSVIAYDLSRYASLLGRLDEANNWLEKAMRFGDAKKIKMRALEEPDLEPLWDHVLK